MTDPPKKPELVDIALAIADGGMGWLHSEDLASDFRTMLLSLRHLVVTSATAPTVPQLKVLHSFAEHPRPNLIQLRKSLESGAVRLPPVIEDAALKWQAALVKAGFTVELVPLTEEERHRRLADVGLKP